MTNSLKEESSFLFVFKFVIEIPYNRYLLIFIRLRKFKNNCLK